MALRFIGSGTTDADGRVSVSYEGKGAGKLQLVAKNGSLQSETYSLLDCIVYDNMETNQYENKYTRDNTATLTYTGGRLQYEYDSSMASTAGYFGFVFINNPTSTAFDIDPLKGADVRFEVDTFTENPSPTVEEGMSIRCYVKTTDNTSWGLLTNQQGINTGTNHYSLDYSFPANVTQAWIRFNQWGNTSKVLYIDNWELYPI